MAVTTFEIPLDPQPTEFRINLAGTDYIMRCRWNDQDEGGWFLDIDDAVSGANIISYIPIVAGVDILSGLEYLGIKGQLFCLTDGSANLAPTFENLGSECKLYFNTEVENG